MWAIFFITLMFAIGPCFASISTRTMWQTHKTKHRARSPLQSNHYFYNHSSMPWIWSEGMLEVVSIQRCWNLSFTGSNMVRSWIQDKETGPELKLLEYTYHAAQKGMGAFKVPPNGFNYHKLHGNIYWAIQGRIVGALETCIQLRTQTSKHEMSVWYNTMWLKLQT